MSFQIENNLKLRGWIDSRIGGRSENQDYAGSYSTAHGTIVTVCDGMGGMGGGATASRIAVQTIIEDYIQRSGSIEDDSAFLKETISHANNAIRQHSFDSPELAHMGTTVTAIIITKQCATIAHVGDSRVYQLRGKHKVFRTTDHSAVFEKVKSGKLTEEEARVHPNSNIILKALGVDGVVEASVESVPYAPGDRFILCTDGFWGSMPEKDFIKLVSHSNARRTLQKAIEEIDRVGAENGGGHDNLTAAIIDVNTNSKVRTKMRKGDKILFAILGVVLLASLALNAVLLLETRKESKEKNVVVVVQDMSADSTVIKQPLK